MHISFHEQLLIHWHWMTSYESFVFLNEIWNRTDKDITSMQGMGEYVTGMHKELFINLSYN